jgi:hypothetical protein
MEDPAGRRPAPKLVRLPLLASTELDICASFCTPYTPPSPRNSPLRLSSAEFSLQRSFRQEDLRNELPDCSSVPSPLTGSYLPNSPHSLLHPSSPLPPNRQPDDRLSPAGLYTFVPSSCTYSHAGQRYRDHAACTEKPFKALFIGDSHTRATYETIGWRMWGNTTWLLDSPKELEKNETIGALDLVRFFCSLLPHLASLSLALTCPFFPPSLCAVLQMVLFPFFLVCFFRS